ncbi:MAG: hypothetical protein ACOYW7_07400 [Nitrospirota bacterium]
MLVKKTFAAGMSCFLVVAVLISFTHAAVQKSIGLLPTPDAAAAQGTALIKEPDFSIRGAEEQKELVLNVSGLEQNAVYSVWLVNERPKMDMVRVGYGDASFRTDATGSGRFTAILPASELKKWNMIQVAHHPDGNPKNTNTMKMALKAYID